MSHCGEGLPSGSGVVEWPDPPITRAARGKPSAVGFLQGSSGWILQVGRAGSAETVAMGRTGTRP